MGNMLLSSPSSEIIWFKDVQSNSSWKSDSNIFNAVMIDNDPLIPIKCWPDIAIYSFDFDVVMSASVPGTILYFENPSGTYTFISFKFETPENQTIKRKYNIVFNPLKIDVELPFDIG